MTPRGGVCPTPASQMPPSQGNRDGVCLADVPSPRMLRTKNKTRHRLTVAAAGRASVQRFLANPDARRPANESGCPAHRRQVSLGPTSPVREKPNCTRLMAARAESTRETSASICSCASYTDTRTCRFRGTGPSVDKGAPMPSYYEESITERAVHVGPPPLLFAGPRVRIA